MDEDPPGLLQVGFRFWGLGFGVETLPFASYIRAHYAGLLQVVWQTILMLTCQHKNTPILKLTCRVSGTNLSTLSKKQVGIP